MSDRPLGGKNVGWTLGELQQLFTLCEARGVTKLHLGDLEVEFQPEIKLSPADLDALEGKDPNAPPAPKTAYELALERAAGS